MQRLQIDFFFITSTRFCMVKPENGRRRESRYGSAESNT